MSILPGVTLNLSKSGVSTSVGPRRAKFTFGPRGTRATAGIPGTGLFYTTTNPLSLNKRQGTSRKAQDTNQPPPPLPVPTQPASLDPGFFDNLVISPEEQALVNGFQEIVKGDKNAALQYLRNASHTADGAFMAGILCLEMLLLEDAEKYLVFTITHEADIGKYFRKYKVSAGVNLAITDELTANVQVIPTAARLAMVEIYQRQQRWNEAINILQKLYSSYPEDPVIRLSVIELLMVTRPADKRAFKRVIRLTEDVKNDSPVHAGLLLYKARALRGLGMPAAALDTLTATLKQAGSLSHELIRALRYDRALALEELGRQVEYQAEIRKLYAEDPDYEDVAARVSEK